ncbi:MAG: glycerol-3-phosphate 1-O-acyltransferase PlsY [Pseudomonadota bacterium]
MTDAIVKILLAYAAGSIMGSLLLGRFRALDIRNMGSGNAGATNALRSGGKLFALGVMVIDVGKGALAAGVIPGLALGLGASPAWLPFACGGAAVFGHCYPLFHGFRGGKGAATLVGTFLVFAPILVVPLLAVWVATILVIGFVGLATMITAHAAWVIIAAFWLPEQNALFVYALVMACFIVFTHRSNITRMREGTESRLGQLSVFRK